MDSRLRSPCPTGSTATPPAGRATGSATPPSRKSASPGSKSGFWIARTIYRTLPKIRLARGSGHPELCFYWVPACAGTTKKEFFIVFYGGLKNALSLFFFGGGRYFATAAASLARI